MFREMHRTAGGITRVRISQALVAPIILAFCTSGMPPSSIGNSVMGHCADGGERTLLSDVIVGSCMMLISLACAVAYAFVLVTIWRDDELMKMPTYRFMFVLGIFDVLPCIPHFITGIFTICQSVFHPLLAKSISILGTPCYVAYCIITVILSFNRFLVVVSPKYNEALFSIRRTYLWYGVIVLFWLVFALLLASPWATLVYVPAEYSWTYDFNLPLSSAVQKSAMGLELLCITIFGIFYLCTLVVLYLTRKRFTSNIKSKAELKILIQCIVVAAYCTVMNTLWHQSQMFPSNLWSKMALNFMWVINSGVYPTIYFIVNRTLRTRIVCNNKKMTFLSHSRVPSDRRP